METWRAEELRDGAGPTVVQKVQPAQGPKFWGAQIFYIGIILKRNALVGCWALRRCSGLCRSRSGLESYRSDEEATRASSE